MKEHTMQTRRDTLKQGLLAAGALGSGVMLTGPAHAFNKTAFDARSVQEAVKALGGTSLTESKDVTVQGPDIAENGAVVPIGATTTMAGVKHLALLVEKNPSALVAVFNVNPAVDSSFSTRAKMGQSSDVYAVAIAQDGKAFFAKKEIKVTLGGCGG
jgi:sulfur-oxidizing protein SoxY